MSDITFLFGAGTEMCYGLPGGPEFTKETLLTKRDNMYDALTKFYATRKEFADVYISRFHLNRNSVEFYKIILQTAQFIKCDECKHVLKCQFSGNNLSSFNFCQDEIDDLNSKDTRWGNFKRNVNELNLFDNIVLEQSQSNSNFECIKNNLTFYGAIEKKFSSIANPRKAGITTFWQIINYYWGAWFSVLTPILMRSTRYKDKISDNKYKFILNNLNKITDYISDLDSLLDGYEYDKELHDKDYYKAIKKEFNYVNVITTNYTPFCKIIKDDVAYLAGELQKFELPNEFTVKNAKNIAENDFVFPFIMTQAPIKPIINTYQLREYGKAMNYLDNSNILIVLGYSFCEGDNHINAIIREYVVENKVKMIYCSYSEKGKFDKEEIKKQLKTSLKIKDENIEKISIIENNGKPKVLINAIKKEIDKITKEGKINVE